MTETANAIDGPLDLEQFAGCGTFSALDDGLKRWSIKGGDRVVVDSTATPHDGCFVAVMLPGDWTPRIRAWRPDPNGNVWLQKPVEDGMAWDILGDTRVLGVVVGVVRVF